MRNGTLPLFIPGPTNMPEPVRQAMNVPMQDMRAPDFGELTLSLFDDLRQVFRSREAEIFLFPGSGTGAWEAAITNTLNPGDKVLMSRFGQFSALWVEMAERLGLDAVRLDVTVQNARARALYERMGFEPVAARRAGLAGHALGLRAVTTMRRPVGAAGPPRTD